MKCHWLNCCLFGANESIKQPRRRTRDRGKLWSFYANFQIFLFLIFHLLTWNILFCGLTNEPLLNFFFRAGDGLGFKVRGRQQRCLITRVCLVYSLHWINVLALLRRSLSLSFTLCVILPKKRPYSAEAKYEDLRFKNPALELKTSAV